jgi:hypothetical protein
MPNQKRVLEMHSFYFFHRLQTTSEYLTSPNSDSFTMELTNTKPNMAIVGLRIQLGKGRFVPSLLHYLRLVRDL